MSSKAAPPPHHLYLHFCIAITKRGGWLFLEPEPSGSSHNVCRLRSRAVFHCWERVGGTEVSCYGSEAEAPAP